MIRAAVIVQTAPDSHPVLRPHTLNVGLYGGGRSTAISVEIDGERDRVAGAGRPAAPEFVLLNDGDLTYAKVRFDDGSLAALPRLLPQLSPLNRAMVWCALLLSVQDAVLPGRDYLDLVMAHGGGRAGAVDPHRGAGAGPQRRPDRFLDAVRAPGAAGPARRRVPESGCSRSPPVTSVGPLFRDLIDFSTDVAELRGDGLPARLPGRVPAGRRPAWRIGTGWRCSVT